MVNQKIVRLIINFFFNKFSISNIKIQYIYTRVTQNILNENCRGEKGLQKGVHVERNENKTKRNCWNYFRKLGHASTIDCVTLVHSSCAVITVQRIQYGHFYRDTVFPVLAFDFAIYLSWTKRWSVYQRDFSFLLFGKNFNITCLPFLL